MTAPRHNNDLSGISMDESEQPRKRRMRYRSTHPRRFEEKYKEHNPERYPEDVAKVISRGNTPAGSHRPICVEEILQVLEPYPGQIGLDATLGYGGHARELLARIVPGGKLWALDVDGQEILRTEQRLRALGYGEDVLCTRQLNFAGINKLLAEVEHGFDFILADLGVSSMQLDNPARGFSFKRKGPIDLRLNPERGQPASALLQTLSKEALAKLLTEASDEPYAEDIAAILVERRARLRTTLDLAKAVRDALPPPKEEAESTAATTSVRRVFQALRIAVNDEFAVLEHFLRSLPLCLKPRGKIAILTFHSGEAKRVSESFQRGLERKVYAKVCAHPLQPSRQEIYDNPRAKSALLHWAVRSAMPYNP